jgi:hypothetical protein
VRFNRDIIIQSDVDKYLDPTQRNPKTLSGGPPKTNPYNAPQADLGLRSMWTRTVVPPWSVQISTRSQT